MLFLFPFLVFSALPALSQAEDLRFHPWSRDEAQALHVCWLSQGYEEEKSWVEAAVIAQYNERSPFQFIGFRPCDEALDAPNLIQITIADVPPHTKGFGAALNHKRHGMVLNFEFKTVSHPKCHGPWRRVCLVTYGLHEFGHAAGLPDACIGPRDQCEETSYTIYQNPYHISEPESIMNSGGFDFEREPELTKLDLQILFDIYYGAPVRPAYEGEDF